MASPSNDLSESGTIVFFIPLSMMNQIVPTFLVCGKQIMSHGPEKDKKKI